MAKENDIGHLLDKDISDMEFMINSTPRKVLGGLTQLEAYTGKSVALIA